MLRIGGETIQVTPKRQRRVNRRVKGRATNFIKPLFF